MLVNLLGSRAGELSATVDRLSLRVDFELLLLCSFLPTLCRSTRQCAAALADYTFVMSSCETYFARLLVTPVTLLAEHSAN